MASHITLNSDRFARRQAEQRLSLFQFAVSWGQCRLDPGVAVNLLKPSGYFIKLESSLASSFFFMFGALTVLFI